MAPERSLLPWGETVMGWDLGTEDGQHRVGGTVLNWSHTLTLWPPWVGQ